MSSAPRRPGAGGLELQGDELRVAAKVAEEAVALVAGLALDEHLRREARLPPSTTVKWMCGVRPDRRPGGWCGSGSGPSASVRDLAEALEVGIAFGFAHVVVLPSASHLPDSRPWPRCATDFPERIDDQPTHLEHGAARDARTGARRA
jgi:hypothetical protein